jgi:signal transduction histidine kinase/predicted transcriptional regulator
MTERQGLLPIRSLGMVTTLTILVLGTLISVFGWQSLRRQLELEMARQTSLYANTLTDTVERQIDGLARVLKRRSEMWAEPAISEPQWREFVDVFMRENPAVLAIEQPGRPIAGTEVGNEVLKQFLATAEEGEPTLSGDAEVIGQLRYSEGRPLLGMHVRPELEHPKSGSIFAVLDARALLAAQLAERALGYGIRVSADGEEIYRRLHPDATSLHELAQSDNISLSAGSTWELSLWPTQEGSAAFYRDGPLVALIAGLLASALLALAVHYGTLARQRSEALRDTNRDLERQVAEREKGEGDLKRLSEELEERVAQRTAELNETIVELETFNYSVSHDLRGPLGAVINFAAILGEDYRDRLDANGQECLTRIVRSAGVAVSMMDALLAYSRSGRTELRKVPLDMRRLVREVISESLAATPQLVCNVKIGDLPDAFADENMMRFIFTNLISNACKFAQPGQDPHVEVSGSVAAGEVTYSVRDAGIGFDMRFADKLFKVFERLHPSGNFDGHGVGLAIVARMVRRHGGRVWAHGAVGKGATFFFTVPVLDGNHVRAEKS